MRLGPLIVGQRTAMLVGLGLVSAATIGLAFVFLRLFAAAFGEHFAPVGLSLGLFGCGLGAALVGAFPRLAAPPRLFSRLAIFVALSSLATVFAMIRTLRALAPQVLDRPALTSIGLHYLVSSLPFVGAGVALASAFRFSRGRVASVFGASCVGAAFGAVLIVLLMRVGAPRAGLFLALMLGLAAIILALGSREQSGFYSFQEERGSGWFAAAFFLGSLALVAGDYGEQWLTVPQLRQAAVEKASFVEWNELGLVTVDRPTRGKAMLRIDAGATAPILEAKGRPPRRQSALVYVLSKRAGPTLVLNAGAGTDIRAALEADQTEVVAVELNRAVIEGVMSGKIRLFGGGIYEQPGVSVVLADSRAYIAGTNRQYRNIVIAPVENPAALSNAGLATTPDTLFTVEGFKDLVGRLTEDGALVVVRPEQELERLLAVSAAALHKRASPKPLDHLFACSDEGSVVLLVKRAPIAVDELTNLHNHCKSNHYTTLLSPDGTASESYVQIVADPWGTFAPSRVSRFLPATDDRPFYFSSLSRATLRETLKPRVLAKDQQALLITLVLFAASLFAGLVIAAVAVLAPTSSAKRASSSASIAFNPRSTWGRRGKRARLLVFAVFGAVAVTLALVALAPLLNRLLGHPMFSLTILAPAFLLAAWAGGFITRRVSAYRLPSTAATRAQVLTILLVLLAVCALPLIQAFARSPLPLRFALALLITVSVGLLAGTQPSLGAALAVSRSGRFTVWLTAAGFFFAAAALFCGLLVALLLGYSYLLLVAALAAFVASALVPPSLWTRNR